MQDLFHQYYQIIIQERNWSWTLVVIAYLFLTMIMRGWFLKPLITQAKILDRKRYHDIRSSYLKKSIWGWLLLGASCACIVLLWYHATLIPFTFREFVLIAGATTTLVLSFIFHLMAFGMAALEVLRHAENDQKVL